MKAFIGKRLQLYCNMRVGTYLSIHEFVLDNFWALLFVCRHLIYLIICSLSDLASHA